MPGLSLRLDKKISKYLQLYNSDNPSAVKKVQVSKDANKTPMALGIIIL